MAGGQGRGVVVAEDSLADRQQGSELVTGTSRITGLPCPAGELTAGGSGVPGWSGPRTCLKVGSKAASWSRAPAASPASPVQRARSWRVFRVRMWSPPRIRSESASRAANWSRAPAASPASPVQCARLLRTRRVPRSSGPRTRSESAQQDGELVAGTGRIPGLSSEVGEVVARGHGSWVVSSQDLFLEGQQHGVLIAGPCSHPPHSRPTRQGCRGRQGSGWSGPRTRS